MKNLYPIRKELAINLLRIIIKIQAEEKIQKVIDEIELGKIPQLETVLDKQLHIIEGGGVLLNLFHNNQLTVELKERVEYGSNSEIDFSRKELLNHTKPKTTKRKRIKRITQLPDEILVKVLTYSQNINNMALSCKFFNNFVLSHKEFISYELIESKYVHRYKLKQVADIDLIMEDDHTQYQNSHKFAIDDGIDEGYISLREMILSDYKFTEDEKYTSARYRNTDILTVISAGAFETPYLTYENYKSLQIDRVIPSSSWPDMEEQYEDALSRYGETHIEKSVFNDFWNELSVGMPYINNQNPLNLSQIKDGTYVDKFRILLDLMVNRTRFTNNLEDIIAFLVALTVKIEESIMEHEGSILPPQILKDYCIFYMRQLKKSGDEDDSEAELDDSDEMVWEKVQLKSPYLYVFLKHQANEELEELLCPRFYYESIADVASFWIGLKQQQGDDLIEEIINEVGISPTLNILAALASY
ncbi:hypothetical protein CANINC_005052 [Pichia inconspicua]|uniref:F-box domain-containing protein n=1 Tax=Pichia inconspicua TaxID=52247 RepID=A0A4T0WUH1_9ASCO|nr:hypothetical protein CANINC_005052 [[Candida] inconspicua]